LLVLAGMADRRADIHFERLSALDATFLDIETRVSSMAVGALCVFDGGDLVGPEGQVDVDRIRGFVAAAMPRIPRYRQRVTRVPGVGQPVWIDDDTFSLDFHVRHTRLPWPGDDRQLHRLAGRVFSQRLDRDHPLWELWVVEGVGAGDAAARAQFAVIIKAHHCMVDGVAGAGLLAAMLRPFAETHVTPAPTWTPRPPPGPLALLRAEIAHHNRRALALARRTAAGLRHGLSADGRAAGHGVVASLGAVARPACATPLNPPRIGSQRRFETLALELAAVKDVRQVLGGTVNDVALAVVTGGLRRYFARHRLDPAVMTPMRALVPVNLRLPGQPGLGNRIAEVLLELPVGEPDARARLRLVQERTRQLKHESGQIAAAAMIEDLADTVATRLVSTIFRTATRVRAFNLVITNVAGPQVPLYLLSARLRAIYPLVPLFETQGLGVALFSYDGTLFVGVSACMRTVSDLDAVVEDMTSSFAEYRSLAATHAPATGCAPDVRPDPHV
jgi:WS/DGAT/MGAT family acyltransferase